MSSNRAAPPALEFPHVGAPPAPVVPRPEKFILDNGLRVVVAERHDLPQIAARLILPAGSASEPAQAPGSASLVGTLLTEGTEERSAVELNDRIDSLGASLSARVGHDFAEIDLGLLTETAEEGFALFAEVIIKPTFPDREVERIRAEVLDALDARRDEPANIADDRTALALFGPSHPYGRIPLGTSDGIRAIRRVDLQAFHGNRYRPKGSVLIIAGDVTLAELMPILERTFGEWTGTADATAYPRPPAAPIEVGRLASVDWEDAAQGEIRVAGLGMPRISADWIPAAVANYILGGSTITGRLGSNLREDKGWTYGVRSGFAAGVQSGGWVIETAVDAQITSDALAEIEKELTAMTTVPVAEEELARAKEALILSLPRAFETPGRAVARLGTVEAFGLPEDYWQIFPTLVQRVTRDEVSSVASRYFAPERLVRVTVSPGQTEVS